MNQLSIAVKDNKTTEFIAAITPSYGKTLKDNGVDIKDSYNAVNDDVRDLKYITIPTTNIQSGAKAGKYTLILTIKDTKMVMKSRRLKCLYPSHCLHLLKFSRSQQLGMTM